MITVYQVSRRYIGLMLFMLNTKKLTFNWFVAVNYTGKLRNQLNLELLFYFFNNFFIKFKVKLKVKSKTSNMAFRLSLLYIVFTALLFNSQLNTAVSTQQLNNKLKF